MFDYDKVFFTRDEIEQYTRLRNAADSYLTRIINHRVAEMIMENKKK